MNNSELNPPVPASPIAEAIMFYAVCAFRYRPMSREPATIF